MHSRSYWKILAIALVILQTGCGDLLDEASENMDENQQLNWQNDIALVIEQGCSGSTCHSGSSSQNIYVGNENLVQSNSAAILDRILRSTGDSMQMPPSSSQVIFSADDKQKLIDYLNQ